MDEKLVVQSIITRDKETLKIALNKKTYLEVFSHLSEMIICELDILNSSIIDKIINLFYDLIHDLENDLDTVLNLLNKINDKITCGLNNYQGDIYKDDTYHYYKKIEKRIESFKDLVIQYSLNPKTSCEYDLLSYLITEMKSYKYLESLIKRKPKLLALEKDGVLIFDLFILDYIKNIDKKEYTLFYEQALRLFLEHKELKINSEIFKKLIETNNQSINKIKDIIGEYIPDLDIKKRKMTRNILLNRQSLPDYKKPRQVTTRLDFRGHKTISIDSILVKETGEMILFDDAFTLFKNGSGYVIYIHIADVPSFIDRNPVLNEELKKIIFSINDGNKYYPLMDQSYVNDYISLKPNMDRFTMTIACEVEPSGQIVGVNFYESLINNTKAFTCDEVNDIINGKKHDDAYLINEYAYLTTLIAGDNKNLGNHIPSYLNVLAGKVTAEYFAREKLPFIYRNCVKVNNLVQEESRKKFNNFLVNNINETYLDHFAHDIEHTTHSFYSVENKGHYHLGLRAYGEIGRPIRNYVSIILLQGIKEMILKQSTLETQERLLKEYEILAQRSNTIEASLNLKR